MTSQKTAAKKTSILEVAKDLMSLEKVSVWYKVFFKSKLTQALFYVHHDKVAKFIV